MILIVIFSQILSRNIHGKNEASINKIRKLEKEIIKILKENNEEKNEFNHNVASKINPGNIKLSDIKSNHLDSKNENISNFDEFDFNVLRETLKNEIEEPESLLKRLGSDIQMPGTHIELNDDKAVSSTLSEIKEPLSYDKGSKPLLKTVVGSILNKKSSPLAAAQDELNGVFSNKDSLNFKNIEPSNRITEFKSKPGDFSALKYGKISLENTNGSKFKNGFKPLDQIKKKGEDKTIFPEKNFKNYTLSGDSKESDVVVKTDEIDRDETIKKLKSENDILKEQIKLDSMKNKVLVQTLKDNIRKKGKLKEASHERHPISKRLDAPKLPVPKPAFVNKHPDMPNKSHMAKNIDTKLEEANEDVKNARILHNNATLHKKAADSLKTSAEVENMVAKEIGSATSLGSKIREKSARDNLRAIAFEEKAEKERINSDFLLGHALGKIETVEDTEIAETSD